MLDSISLQPITKPVQGTFELPLSKSMVNRALLLAAMYPEITLSGMSTSSDSVYLQQVLDGYLGDSAMVGAGGTTLRFATAYWACQEGAEMELYGTERLNKRPIAPLVDALNALGASVSYTAAEGEAPLRIQGRNLKGGRLHLGHVSSSQFITALMLISPKMKEGLHLTWDSAPSQPYLVMTAALLRESGFEVLLTAEEFKISAGQQPKKVELFIERDWSAVAFWCEVVALSNEANIELLGFKPESLQGDSRVLDYFEPLGVKSAFENGSLILTKKPILPLGKFTANLISEPDLAQALITTLLVTKVPFEIHGLQTLTTKETNRIVALEQLAQSLGITVRSTRDSLSCVDYPDVFTSGPKSYDSLEDHRVAMSLAPLSLRFPVTINDPSVVAKSYPEFWNHFSQL